jgi:hypothetical protein
MSDYGFPKFGWMARVAEDDRLSDGAVRILTYIANQNVHGSDDWFRVRQQTVADNLHMHVNTVANALKRARELGWLELAEERQRGGAGKADTYRLTVPAGGPPCWSSHGEVPTRGSGSVPTPGSGLEDEVPTPGVTSTHTPGEKYPHGEVEVPTSPVFKNGVSPAETQTLQGLYPGFVVQGLKPGCADASGAAARAAALVEEWIPGDLRLGGAKRVLVAAVLDGLGGLGEEGTAQVVAGWLEMRQPTSWDLRALIDIALNGDAP